MNRSFSLSLAAVDVLSQLLRVNCRLYPFEIPSFGQYAEDRNRIARAVFTDLAGRGLIGPDGVADDVERALAVTADHEVGVAVSGSLAPGKLIRARAAASGDTGVLAVQEGQSLRFELVGAPGLARALVGLLPLASPGPGQSVQIEQPAATVPGGGFAQPVRAPRSAADAQLRMAATMLERPRKGFGFFTITGKGRHGREVDAGNLGWIDTDAGRYLTLTRPSPDGALRATYSPADSARLAQQLDGLLQAAR